MYESRLKSSLLTSSGLSSSSSLKQPSILMSSKTTSSTLNASSLNSSLLSSSTLKATNFLTTTSFGLTTKSLTTDVGVSERKKKLDAVSFTEAEETKKPKLLTSTEPKTTDLPLSNPSLLSSSTTKTATLLSNPLAKSLVSTSNSTAYHLNPVQKTILTLNTDLLNSNSKSLLSGVTTKISILTSDKLDEKAEVVLKRQRSDNDERKVPQEDYDFTVPESLMQMIECQLASSRPDELSRGKTKKLKTSRSQPSPGTPTLGLVLSKKNELIAAKNALINVVSSSLIREPNFKNVQDPTRQIIFTLAQRVTLADAQFVLKLALYTRRELNIRVTGNFLVSLAAFLDASRPHLHRFFKQSIILPSDWIDVAEQYQLFMDKRINFGALPSALRKSMVEKFPDFDKYQLAKYNKEKSRMAKNSTLRDVKHMKSRVSAGEEGAIADEKLVEEKYIKTLKKGVAINDRISIEIVVKDGCKNLKIDVLQRVEGDSAKQPTNFGRRGAARVTEKKKENADSIAVRIRIDYENSRIVQKSFLKKVWTKRGEEVRKPRGFEFVHSFDSIFFFVDVKPSEFVFGTIKDGKETTLAKYAHSKHNIQLNKLNCVRISGSKIKLKDLAVGSQEIVHMDSQPDETELKRRSYTIKQLIRQLHISQPVDNVMSLIGKKYPSTFEEFVQLKLPGLFESERAGKRMKLPVPETWETQISLRGNKAQVWEQLIDNKKLPYMAMLRNLRNMIKCGISERHHQWVIKKLQDEGAVIHSKQFPFRFFTAYSVLDELKDEFEEYMKWSQSPEAQADTAAAPATKARRPVRGGKKTATDKTTKSTFKDMNYDLEILKRYKTALDNALKAATTYNVSPIKGSTLILLNLSLKGGDATRMGKSLGKRVTSVAEIAALLALMFKYACENCKLVAFSNGLTYENFQLDESTILDNMKSLVTLKNMIPSGPTDYVNYPKRTLNEILEKRELFDNMVILSSALGDAEVTFQQDFLRKYRAIINEQLLFVNVDLGTDECKIVSNELYDHENDICISGFSDSILRFVATRGSQAQLIHIENIEKAYDIVTSVKNKSAGEKNSNKHSEELKSSLETKLSLIERPSVLLKRFVPMNEWHTIKVFISSTFRDMHSERDLLAKTIFPLLRSQLAKYSINVYDIDLRWGIAPGSDPNQTLDLCLTQVLKSDFFLGFLGERYGLVLTDYALKSKNPALNWLTTYSPGASITELEIQTKLNRADETQDRKIRNTFFFFRNHESFIRDVPIELRDHFDESSSDSVAKLAALKQRLRQHTSYEILDEYKCFWQDMDASGRAILSGLESVAVRAFNNLYNSILRDYQERISMVELDENIHFNGLTEIFMRSQAEGFVGRESALKRFEKIMEETKIQEVFTWSSESIRVQAKEKNSHINMILIIGEAGCGKSAFLGRYLQQEEQKKKLNSTSLIDGYFVHCVGAYPNSEYTTMMLKRIVVNINRQFSFGLDDTLLVESNDANIHRQAFVTIMEKLDQLLAERKLYIIIDGVDHLLDDQGSPDHSFSWLPTRISAKLVFVFTARSSSPTRLALEKLASNSGNTSNRIQLISFELESFDVLDKSQFVRAQLLKFNKYLDENPFNNQMKLLTGKRESNDPLYLTLACEELRLHGHFETLSAKIKQLPVKLNKLLEYTLDRLQAEYGEAFLNSALMFICCSRDGLEEQELRDLLDIFFAIVNSKTTKVIAESIETSNSLFDALDKPTLKRILFSRKWIATDKFLSFVEAISTTFLRPRKQKSNQLIAIKKNILIENTLRARLTQNFHHNEATIRPSIKLIHRLMALYFWSRINTELEKSWLPNSNIYSRSLTYMPYHLIMSGLQVDAMSMVSDLMFIYLKCDNGLASELADDFDLHESWCIKSILGKNSNFFAKKSSVAYKPKQMNSTSLTNMELINTNFLAYKLFIMSNFHLIIANPRLILQQAMNEPDTSVVSLDARSLLRKYSDKLNASYILEWVTKSDDNASFNMAPTVLNEFDDAVSCVSLSPDGSWIACGTENCEIKLFAVNTAKFVRKFHGHSGRINSIVFVDSKTLCSASSDGLACLWNLDEGFRIRVLNKHNDHVVKDCCAEHKGKSLVTVGWDCTAKIWSTQEGNVIGELKHPRPINCIVFHPDGSQLATGCWDSCIRIYNYVNRARKAVLRGHKTSVRSISFSFNGVFIASASIDGDVKLWNSKHGAQLATLRGHTLPVNSICFSPKNQFLVTASSDRTVKIWPGGVGRLIRIVHDDKKPLDSISSICFEQSNGELFASATHSGEIRLYELYGGELKSHLRPHQARIRRVKFLAGRSDYLITASEDGTCRLLFISESGMTTVAELAASNAPASVTALDINKYFLLVTGSEDSSVNVYTDFMQNIPGPEFASRIAKFRPSLCLNAHKSPLTACSFNETGDKFATSSKDATVIVWEYSYNTETAHELFVINRGHEDWITDMAWSPTADFILTASNDFTLKIWNANDGQEKARLVGHTSSISSCSFRFGCAVSTSCDGTIKIWSHRGHEITTLYGHTAKVNACDIFVKIRQAFKIEIDQESKESGGKEDMEIGMLWSDRVEMDALKDKKKEVESKRNAFDIEDVYLVSGGDDNTVRVWKPIESNYLASLENHNGRVNSINLNSRDIVASSSDDRTVALTNLSAFFSRHESNIECERRVRGHMSEVTSLCVSESRDMVISGSLDGAVYIWQLASGCNSLDFILDFKAHDQYCSSICVISEKIDRGIKTLKFATCGNSEVIRVWELKQTSRPSIRLVQVVHKKRGNANAKFVFVGKTTITEKEYLVGVQTIGENFIVSLFTNIYETITHGSGGCILICKSPIYSKIELKNDKLYIALIDDEIFEFNLAECVKKLHSLNYQFSGANEHVFKRLKNKSATNNETSKSVWNKIWYTALEVDTNNNLLVGDWKGNVYNRHSSSDSLDLVKQIVQTRTTAIRFMRRTPSNNEERIVSGDKEGIVHIWNKNFGEQLGMFKNTCEITQLLTVLDADNKSQGIIVGDKSGSINLIKWYE